MAFTHIAINGGTILYWTKGKENYKLGGFGNYLPKGSSAAEGFQRYASDLQAGEHLGVDFTPENLRELIGLSPGEVRVTCRNQEVLKKFFGYYNRTGDPLAPYVVVAKGSASSPLGAGISMRAEHPTDPHESLLHQLSARLLGHPTNHPHEEHGEPADSQSQHPTEFYERHLGGNTFVWEPRKPKNNS
mgnify:CR=1 FL=1